MILSQKQRSAHRFLLAAVLTLPGNCWLSLPSYAQAPVGNLPAHPAKLSWTNGVDPSGDTITGSNVR